MEDALDAIGLGRFHVLLLLCVSLVWAGDAMEVMILSYLGPATACQFGFSASQQSLLSSAVFGGMVLGAAAWGLAADALGRRATLAASAAVVVAAGLASAAAPGYAVLLLSRACVGFGLAGAPVGFTLLMELLPAGSRATWGTAVELAWTAGTVLEAGLAWALLNSFGWRPLLVASVAPLVLLLLLIQHLPESPRYLLAQGDAAAAQAVLQRIAAVNGKQLHFATDGAVASGFAGSIVANDQQQQQQQQQRATDDARRLDSTDGVDSSKRQRLLGGEQHTFSDQAGTDQQHQQQVLQHIAVHALDVETGKADRAQSSTTSSRNETDLAAAAQSASKDQHRHSQQQLPTAGAKPVPGAYQPGDTDTNPDVQTQQQQQQQQQLSSGNTPASSPKYPTASSPTRKHLQQQQQQQQWSVFGSQQLQQLLAEARLAAALLSRPPYASTTALLLFAWGTTSFAYYGLVQLVAQLHLEAAAPAAAAAAGAAAAAAAAGGSGPTCADGSLQVPSSEHLSGLLTSAAEPPAVPSSEYLSVLLTSAAEVPAVAWAAASANWLGRRTAIATSLGLTAACLVPCMVAAAAAAAGGGSAGVGMDSDTAGWSTWAVNAAAAGMFGARLFVMSSFTLLWVLTPELYPTHVRAFGLGINNACARIGGLLSPFAAINLVALGAPAAAEGVFAAACVAACAAVLAISPKHDSGQPMEEEE
ncbi:hypothetical protein OEZ85_007499 [Tetradesmus obliquus]|uniref:Major facilitator superfamily (MFS) profile domain-containing protein n=1 Tax=Tetradesmus obliquus TaxID=3088 RepID=A0ABY8TGK9_TETOB|nr:hypothetical protein OEZ85_007499 [Tetradesmus obliquus]